MGKTSLGDRMKRYERSFRTYLPPRMPVIIRVDGRAFHTLTQNLKKPFDANFVGIMNTVAKALCSEIQGAQFAYVQSDEISIFVHGYKRFESQVWFNNNLQKMVSISAAVASSVFTQESWKLWIPEPGHPDHNMVQYRDRAEFVSRVQFDSRAFVLPEAEVCNYFVWRQRDFERNSIQMLARSLYSHKQCTDLNTSELNEICFKAGHNWNDLPTHLKRGRCVVLKSSFGPEGQTRSSWKVDNEIPRFSGGDREYIEQYLAVLPEDQ